MIGKQTDVIAGQHQCEHGFHIVCRGAHIHAVETFLIGAAQMAAQHEGKLRQRGPRHRRHRAEKRMVRSAVKLMTLDQQPAEIEPGDGAHKGADRSMKIMRQNPPFQLGALIDQQLQFDFILKPVELAQCFDQGRMRMGDQRVHHPEPDPPGKALTQRQDAVKMVIQRVEHPFDLLIGHIAPVGQHETRPAALTKPEAETFFQLAHMQ